MSRARETVDTIAARVSGADPDPADLDFPTVQDGARGVHFIETALAGGAGEIIDPYKTLGIKP